MLDLKKNETTRDPSFESSRDGFALGIKGYTYSDLYCPDRLKALTEDFLKEVSAFDPEFARDYSVYLDAKGVGYSRLSQSQLILKMAPYLSRFVARLFGIENERDRLMRETDEQQAIFDFKKDFVQRRVFKKFTTADLQNWDCPAIEQTILELQRLAFPATLSLDGELALARMVVALLKLDREYELFFEKKKIPLTESTCLAVGSIKAALLERKPFSSFLSIDPLQTPEQRDQQFIRKLLELLEQWVFAQFHLYADRIKDWVSYRLPHPIDSRNLVQITRPRADLQEFIQGPEERLRYRDGFKLTDPRYEPREVLDEVNYCIYCHERSKDSCSKGLAEKDGSLRRNPLGIPLAGCPLEEKISEMHMLKRNGDSIAALAVIVVDNPLCAGTGHRICNDCMKSCIFQKQDPVNIPQVETGILTDVLTLPYGLEVYSLLTRWNPLNAQRPYALPYNGKNILVVGMGPAGYTLAQFLLNEGFGVVGIDGLKIEPLPTVLTGEAHTPLKPVRHIENLKSDLEQRVLAGFGGVSEYGITVRWDKNFLTLIHLLLRRRNKFRVYGGVRFGGTITIEDAWEMGFDHIAIATGAGKPTIVPMKNNLIRGIRKASDFLMALQLTGAFKRDAMANLQAELPALVIGGGLTAIDTATELMAYYPNQVEKILYRFETLETRYGKEFIWQDFDEEERERLKRFLNHGRAVRAERQLARAENRLPNFIRLVREWGGVSIVYRRSLVDSPAYRLNHEEVAKSLEEGIAFIERLSPVEAIPDSFGAVQAMAFERMSQSENGKIRGTGERVVLPARTVCVAAGTSPNITYERERPGSFQLEKKQEFFASYKVTRDEDGRLKLIPAEKGETGFFTSYQKDNRFITYYGDNHPVFAGNVVKAMASAKLGYPQVASLFEEELRTLRLEEQPKRDQAFRQLATRLDDELVPHVVRVDRLTPTIVEVIVRAPRAARQFHPGQFYRLQNYEVHSSKLDGSKLMMEGLALTGAWVDKHQGLLSMIVLELGSSSRLCALLRPGEPVVVMGPTGAPTEIPKGETVMLAGGGLGNAVLFSIGKAMRQNGNQVIYFAGYKKGEDLYKKDEVEDSCDQVIWSTDSGSEIQTRRSQDLHFRGNIVQAMKAYAEGRLGKPLFDFRQIGRLIAIGSDRMMAAVKAARRPDGVLGPYFRPDHIAIGSINSPMQCMMKEVCAQCLQVHVDPVTCKVTKAVFSCFSQDQRLDEVDFQNLNDRLRANTVQEKLTNLWLDYLFEKTQVPRI
ncbi:MAG TPA: FAD-dependent oxidoreductase [Terriglobia bacterium]|nr:FAD-dependent oxidoreductase [Terriglobia bacterium]